MDLDDDIESTFVMVDFLESCEENVQNGASDARCWDIYHDVVDACKRETMGDDVSEDIENYLRGALKLPEVTEESSSKSSSDSSDLQNFQSYCTLMSVLMQSNQRNSNTLSERILSLYAKTKLLGHSQLLFAQWSAAVDVYQVTSKNLKVFIEILGRIIKSDKNPREKSILSLLPIASPKQKQPKLQLIPIDEEIEREFWCGSVRLFRKFADFIAISLHVTLNDDESRMLKVNAMREIFVITYQIEELWSNYKDERLNFSVALRTAIERTTCESVDQFIGTKVLSESNKNDEVRVNFLIRLTKFALQRMKEINGDFSEVFKSTSRFHFTECLFRTYDKKLESIIKPVVIEVFQGLHQGSQVTLVISAFKLFDELKKFTKHGSDLCQFYSCNFPEWFSQPAFINAVSSVERIETIIKLDHQVLGLNNFKGSSSAIDLRDLIYALDKFWRQFEWNDERTAEITDFIARDVCRLALIYIDKYSQAVDHDEMSYQTLLVGMITAVENFVFVSSVLQGLLMNFSKEIGDYELRSCVEVYKEAFIAIDCKTNELIVYLVESVEEGLESSIIDVTSSVDEFLHEFSEVFTKLKVDLKQHRFEKVKSLLWMKIIAILHRVIDNSINNHKTQSTFVNLNSIWVHLKDIFESPVANLEVGEKIKTFEESLEWYTMDGTQLIYREYKVQTNLLSQSASATVICSFEGNKLRIQILHAQKIDVLCPASNCSTFVQFRLLHGSTAECFKTKVHENDHFPLFNETFECELTDDQRRQANSLVFFKLKRKHPLLGHFKTLAQGFLPFGDIPDVKEAGKTPLRKEITLVKMADSDNKPMQTLKHRGHSNDEAISRILSKIKSQHSSFSFDDFL